MAWWTWVLLGLALLVVEMATSSGLFALFFGIGAICVAPLALAGAGRALQWLAFTVISLVLLATLRRSVRRRVAARGGQRVDALVGEEVVLLSDLPAGGEAKAELRGVPWSVRAPVAMKAGQRARVERIDGVTLWIRAEQPPPHSQEPTWSPSAPRS